MKEPTRCAWASDDPLYQAYHDEEWGVPLHDDQRFFEFACGFQASVRACLQAMVGDDGTLLGKSFNMLCFFC